MTTIVRATSSPSLSSISISRPLVFYFGDTFDPLMITDMEATYGRPDVVISAAEGTVKDIGYNFYFVPALDLGLLRQIIQIKGFKLPRIDETTHCFFWSINRKTIDRHLMIRLIEFFDFKKFSYTWSEVDRRADCTPLIVEMQDLSAPWLTAELRAHLLAPIQIEKNFIAQYSSQTTETNVRLDHGGFRYVADVQRLSQECAVYILTESMTGTYQHYTFSEKTLWCLINGCFPIWAGNYAQAEMAERLGIDVFSDVIDHSYQYKNTLLERCWHALHDNIKILSDLEFSRELRKRHRDRLLQNCQWVKEHKIKKYLDIQRNELADIGIELDPHYFQFRAPL